MYPDILWV
jgi:hypothetical protein